MSNLKTASWDFIDFNEHNESKKVPKNSLPGSSFAAFAQFEDCGRVPVTLPGASSPRSRAEREEKKKKKIMTMKRQNRGLVSVEKEL